MPTQQTAGTTLREPSHAVLQQAAEWYARLRDGKIAKKGRADWQQWLQAAEENRIAWQYVEEISRGFEPLREVPNSRVAANGLYAANERLRLRRRTFLGLTAMAGSGLLSWLGWLDWREALLPGQLMAWSADHRTQVGEQREIVLADGSRVWLNTASAMDVNFTVDERRIRLMAGEIFIDTASDSSRPFLVDTAQGRLHALGTRFNVRMDRGETRLAVYAGAVEIRTSANSATRVIPSGQQARFTEDRISALEAADIARQAWTNGTLTADNIALREVIRELSRYHKGHLGVADEIADLKVYGNFPIHDTDRILRMLATALPIRVEQPLPWWISLEAKRQPQK